MISSIVIYDCEYLTAPGAMSRYWCGPADPDPLVAQIGAVKLSLTGSFEIEDEIRLFIKPVDRFGQQPALDPFFTELTGVTEQDIATHGLSHDEALDAFDRFSAGAPFFSWGKDEIYLLGISCYISGVPPSIPANRFYNASQLLLDAGMPFEDLEKTSSNQLASYFGIKLGNARSHDALDDARSVALTLLHLLETEKLSAEQIIKRCRAG